MSERERERESKPDLYLSIDLQPVTETDRQRETQRDIETDRRGERKSV